MTVFEASNDTLREYYVFMARRALKDVMRADCDRPPTEISHWRKGHAIYYHEVETLKDEAAAWEFIEKYVGILEKTGWTVLVAKIRP